VLSLPSFLHRRTFYPLSRNPLFYFPLGVFFQKSVFSKVFFPGTSNTDMTKYSHVGGNPLSPPYFLPSSVVRAPFFLLSCVRPLDAVSPEAENSVPRIDQPLYSYVVFFSISFGEPVRIFDVFHTPSPTQDYLQVKPLRRSSEV